MPNEDLKEEKVRSKNVDGLGGGLGIESVLLFV